MEITDIQSAVRMGYLRITDHADEEARNDNLSYDEIHGETKYVVLITVYRPDPSRWINWQRRK
jgi:hypothetical protein